ncbi:hypothetical protein pmac_cds_843 [Pandoravirus macleodensis]|uniref:Uncharacterized protein n=1 Tax=Pandoravirus macleodensis TaxID=2107707 RepID=A0A2U7UHW2_9VIRU|nr:hypothetical protein pmac_cds_843 [Pandoravirus macleodensis]AVK77531.1 hypothetical protein pmac_cds_843 [Pandoravirus macleodensis]UMO80339.1 hypothetical protein [Pandoravirus aubagnensis]
MAAIMLDRVNALSDAGDAADAQFECGTRHVPIRGRLFICIDRALANVLRDAASSARNHAIHDTNDWDGTRAAQHHSDVIGDCDDNGDCVDAAWWIYRSRVAQRLCATASVGDAIERDHPLDVPVRLCGAISSLRRAAHERAMCYSPAGLLRLFERMRARWADGPIGSRLAHLTRPNGPVQRAVVRAALGPPKRASLSSRRRQHSAGSHKRSSQTEATAPPAESWPVAHMTLDFMYRLQCVINRPATTMALARDAPPSPPLADEADNIWRGFD